MNHKTKPAIRMVLTKIVSEELCDENCNVAVLLANIPTEKELARALIKQYMSWTNKDNKILDVNFDERLLNGRYHIVAKYNGESNERAFGIKIEDYATRIARADFSLLSSSAHRFPVYQPVPNPHNGPSFVDDLYKMFEELKVKKAQSIPA